jgi:hypothetical protein
MENIGSSLGEICGKDTSMHALSELPRDILASSAPFHCPAGLC